MVSRLIILLPFLVIINGRSAAESSAQVLAKVDPVQVSVTPPEESRRLIRLPDLEFQLIVNARCSKDHHPASLSVSVADTRRTLLAENIADSADIIVDLSVPASQASPIPVGDFCSSAKPETRELLIRDAFIAHLSLRCIGDDGESITYATRPLAVALTCGSADQGTVESESLMLR